MTSHVVGMGSDVRSTLDHRSNHGCATYGAVGSKVIVVEPTTSSPVVGSHVMGMSCRGGCRIDMLLFWLLNE